jgi:hypothetical protein
LDLSAAALYVYFYVTWVKRLKDTEKRKTAFDNYSNANFSRKKGRDISFLSGLLSAT